MPTLQRATQSWRKFPGFWKAETPPPSCTRRLLLHLLAPLEALYRLVFVLLRQRRKVRRASIPVLCAGNATVGGNGKTPLVETLLRLLLSGGIRAHALTKGYGGSEKGPHLVNPLTDDARQVGDKALLLARLAPTWVAKDRLDGVRAAVRQGAQALVLDDGLQDQRIFKDISFLVVDGERGFGNRRQLPAGPLRQPIQEAVRACQAVVLVTPDTHLVRAELMEKCPVLQARMQSATPRDWSGQRVYAFSGIGHPQKFFRLLRNLGAVLIATKVFANHYIYARREVAELLCKARAQQARLVTTSKDAVRLPPDLRSQVLVLEVVLSFYSQEQIRSLFVSFLPQLSLSGFRRAEAARDKNTNAAERDEPSRTK